ncbi:MAG: hypothetical protein IT289_01125 [Oligoflexia bacterium]|nr:hypothetical protein [Oligoflexia bacterium]
MCSIKQLAEETETNMKFLAFVASMILALGFVGSQAQAAKGGSGFVLAPDVMYTNDNLQLSATSKSDTSRIEVGGRVGWKFSSPLYLGGIYVMDNTSTKPASGASTESNVSGYGASVGLITDNGFALIAHYVISSEFRSVTGSTPASKITYSEGSGFQVDIGYHWMVGSKLRIGPEFSYSSLNFKKQKADNASTTSTADVKYTGIRPSIGFVFIF